MSIDRFERQLPELLAELSIPRVPDYFDDTLRQTARMRQRPRWTFLERWISMDIAAQVPIGTRLVPLRTLLAVALLLLALAAAAILYVGSQPRPAPLFGPAANGAVIVSRSGDVYITDAASGGERVLIGGSTEDIAARFSNDGLTIFFGRVTPEGIVVMAANADGTNVRRVSDTLLHENDGVHVSPDGRSLLVLNTSGGIATLEVHPLARTGEPDVFDLGGITPLAFASWDPSGDAIVFRGYKAGTSMRGFYVVSVDGAAPRALLEVPNVEGLLNNPVISHDGSTIAYWSYEPDAVPGRTCNIHVLDVASGTDRPFLMDPASECESGPQFVDGDRLIAEQVRGEEWQLLVAPLDGRTGARTVGPVWPMDSELWWELSPDRTSVLVATVGGRSQVIALTDGTSRPASLEVGDFLSWQRLPISN